MQLEIGLRPLGKLYSNNVNQFLEVLEVDVVRTQAAGQFPDSLRWIQIGTVRRQKIQSQDMTMLVEPGVQRPRMVPPGIVEDYHHLASMPSSAQQNAHEYLKAFSVECLGRHRHHSPIGRANRTKYGHLFSSRGMQHHGIQVFWRNPHGTA